MEKPTEIVVFGGGCFWCTEAIFQRLQGVVSVAPGYAGGHVSDPTYEQVSSGTTGHAEVIQIKFDPQQLKFHTLLEIFFTLHDPTTLNRQGDDVGEQYRSIILYRNDAQKNEAEKFIQELTAEKIYERPIVTTLKPLKQFYPAEAYHLNYYNQNSGQPYCQLVINPKLEKLRSKFAPLLK